MTIREIAYTLNDALARAPREITDFQVIRSIEIGKKISDYKFFGHKTIFDADGYAYHHGGRKEFQFNIGLEPNADGTQILRYGLALSFEESRSLPDPLNQMETLRQRLNNIISTRPAYFNSLKMWQFSGAGTTRTRGRDHAVRKIPTPNKFDFYFIGDKTAQIPESVNDPQFDEIIKLFDHLFPVYLAVNFEYPLPEDLHTESRLARICWNTNGWQAPSGKSGKSRAADAHEYWAGYGLEEWLFDFSTTIEGWQYAYLRPIQQHWDSYIRKVFDLILYTRHPDGYWAYIGKISNLHVISGKESDNVARIFHEKGWTDQRLQQLRQAIGDPSFMPDDPWTFNCKFRPEDVLFFENYPVRLTEDDHSVPMGRYMLYHAPKQFKTKIALPNKEFTPNSPDSHNSEVAAAREIKMIRHESESWRADIHSAIQIGLHRFLDKKYPNCTRKEASTADGAQRIDLKFKKTDGRFALFEIKTYDNDLRACVRTALGQLLEYAFYDGPDSVAELIIVSQNPLDKKTRGYFLHLQDIVKIPIGYICFDWKSDSILDQFNCQF